MRFDKILANKYRSILSHIGFVFIIIGGIQLLPLLLLPFYPEEICYSLTFILSALTLILLGGIIYLIFHKIQVRYSLSTQESGVIVLIAWLAAFLFSAFPFMKILHLSFPLALFEAVSGWTTTGLSVVDVLSAPKIILFWRSIMQLSGGAGFAIMMVAALTGSSGTGLSEAEGRSEQLVPQIRRSAQMVLLIYCAYLIFGIVAYRIAGMPIFEAINHTFSAISTGGFSTHVESIGYWDLPGIELVTIILMILGNLNFVTAYLLIRYRVRSFLKNGEIRLFALLVPLCSAILFFSTVSQLYPHLSKSIRVSLFEVISALTTTGFSTVSYNSWNDVGIFVIIILMLIGGGSCSTAGGIKQFRIYLIMKSIIWEIRRLLAPQNRVFQNYTWAADQKRYIDDHQTNTIALFITIYLSTFTIGSLILTLSGISLKDALFEFASALGTVGLSVGVTSASMPKAVLWTEIVGMFLGRLEFYIIIVSIIKLIKDLPRLMRIKSN
jgi:trk system potassium uptake protein TrkH